MDKFREETKLNLYLITKWILDEFKDFNQKFYKNKTIKY